jgi:hypothetical protein
MPTARLWWCVTKNATQELFTRVRGRGVLRFSGTKVPGEICRYAKIEALICSRLGETLTAAAPTRLIGS